eukprot:Plantae.Rhodophyta-Purpureofilum_apyrenoidigerum.ctg10002.p1 GENE.Plantae.Rhodophyta-Purpureofilum_apyrenoidigerum.ctg10002~~Plantae.Rhodophyta-Purpureofilum_apyrenoidigerum.ctg10002.p1  ORF type:complete len:514 (+),score=90.38 Plantae.Rhodophyta-Purpureofilum_apyrenoidigerum.ctg10002:307-1848(+)
MLGLTEAGETGVLSHLGKSDELGDNQELFEKWIMRQHELMSPVMDTANMDESKRKQIRKSNESFNTNGRNTTEERRPSSARTIEETQVENSLLAPAEDPQGLQTLIDEYPHVFHDGTTRQDCVVGAEQNIDIAEYDFSDNMNDFLGEFNDFLSERREETSNVGTVRKVRAMSANSIEKQGEDTGAKEKRSLQNTGQNETSSKKRKSSPNLNVSSSHITSLADNTEERDCVNVPGKGILQKQAPSTLEDHLSGKLQMGSDPSQTVVEQMSRRSQTIDDQSKGLYSSWNQDTGAESQTTRDQGSSAKKIGQDAKKRLVWTPALHVRFIKAIDMVGIENAVPKTIVELMNVKGLTTEHVKSHLQKFRNNLRKAKTEDLELNSRYKSLQRRTCFERMSPDLLEREDTQRVSFSTSVLTQIEAQLELQEKATQIQLQMQMIVHRTKTLHRKVLLSIERLAALSTKKEDYHNMVHPVQLGQEQRELQAQLEEQQQLLRQQIEEQEEIRRQLLQYAEGYR